MNRKLWTTAGLLCPAALAAAQVEYEFILVDAFAVNYGLRETYLWDINDHGVACGTTVITQNNTTGYTGFTWEPPDLKTPIAISWPKGISNTGLMAGVGSIHNLATGQSTTGFPLLPGTYYAPIFLGINDGGTAVGYIVTCSSCSNSQGTLQIPYIWNASTGARTLGVPGATGAARINNAGQIVGWIGGNSTPNSYYYDLGLEQYTIMSSVFVNPPNLTPRTTADDINELGVVVGSRNSDNGQTTWGYTWRPGEAPQLLPLPPAGYHPYVRPSGINNAGTVVGAISLLNGSGRAFVHDPVHGVRDLNTLTAPPAGFVLMRATSINQSGWIVGFGAGGGGMYKSFVLRPLNPGCWVNCDNSTQAPVLNIADFGCFLQKFAAGDAYANCDQSTTPPTLNVADFSCFLAKFAAGCP